MSPLSATAIQPTPADTEVAAPGPRSGLGFSDLLSSLPGSKSSSRNSQPQPSDGRSVAKGRPAPAWRVPAIQAHRLTHSAPRDDARRELFPHGEETVAGAPPLTTPGGEQAHAIAAQPTPLSTNAEPTGALLARFVEASAAMTPGSRPISGSAAASAGQRSTPQGQARPVEHAAKGDVIEAGSAADCAAQVGAGREASIAPALPGDAAQLAAGRSDSARQDGAVAPDRAGMAAPARQSPALESGHLRTDEAALASPAQLTPTSEKPTSDGQYPPSGRRSDPTDGTGPAVRPSNARARAEHPVADQLLATPIPPTSGARLALHDPVASSQASGPAASQPIALDGPAVSWTAQIARSLAPLATAEAASRTAHLRLHPETLGAMELSVELRQGKVWASLTTSSPAAHGIVSGALDALERAVTASGLDLQGIHLALGGGGGDRPPYDASPGEPTVDPNATARENSRPTSPPDTVAVAGLTPLRHPGAIDVYA